jgi:hypothetical protein
MLVYKTWMTAGVYSHPDGKKYMRFDWCGWFLFGVLPLIMWRRQS